MRAEHVPAEMDRQILPVLEELNFRRDIPAATPVGVNPLPKIQVTLHAAFQQALKYGTVLHVDSLGICTQRTRAILSIGGTSIGQKTAS